MSSTVAFLSIFSAHSGISAFIFGAISVMSAPEPEKAPSLRMAISRPLILKLVLSANL